MHLIERQLEALSWIADQTSLVAVNAQIEAARLGNQGKGFHVIAGEIQQLSKRARVVSEEISIHVRMALTAGEVALLECSSAAGTGLGSLLAGRKRIAQMSQLIEDLHTFASKQVGKSKDSASRLECLSTSAMNHMQFEDIARQILERSRADLMNLRDVLQQPGTRPESSDSIHSAAFAAYDRIALHKPEQEEMSPGEVEVFWDNKMEGLEDQVVFAPNSLCWAARSDFNRQYRPVREDRRYIVDLSNTIEMDAVGLGLLLQMADALGGDRSRFYIARAQPAVAEILKAASLDDVANFGYPELQA